MDEDKRAEKTEVAKDNHLSQELEMTFPASDPPASIQPGSGVTGPEDTKEAPRPPGTRQGARA